MEILTNDSTYNNPYTTKIFINPNSLSANVCDIIKSKFESSNNSYKGVVHRGLDLKTKDTKDMVIYRNDKEWSDIHNLLNRELTYNITQYLNILNKTDDFKSKYNNTDIPNYLIFTPGNLSYEFFMVQKYTQNVGRYIYHDDFKIDYDTKMIRVITFIWYLNDVEIGGETVFEGKYKIKPETGKLVLFPACWTYPHCGKMPISDNKYIITGWIYSKR
jgi:hypothetical protein